MITQNELHKLFNYDEQSGVFTYAKKVKYAKHKVGDIAGTLSDDGYIRVMIRKKWYQVHRLIWVYVNGTEPNRIDHKNHRRSDNRLSNLRDVTTKINKQNSSLYSTNTSGQCGVSWCKQTKRWRSGIVIDGKHKSLGRFTDFSEAVNARKNAEVLYGFHKNHGNKKDR